MICKLCLQDRELRESHVIPKFAARWLIQNSATGFLRQAVQPNIRKQDFVTERLLCGDCENRFSRWEHLFAETIFLPYLNDRQLEFEYTDWLFNFSVSLIWRLAVTELEDFRSYRPNLVGDLESALSAWRLYLLNDTPMENTYGFHLLFLDIVESVRGGRVPEGFHWYTLQGVDGTLPANTSEVYAYVKLPSMAFFAGITPRRPGGFKNTHILTSGTIKASNQIVRNRVFGNFLIDRAQQAWKLTKATSKRQRSVIQAAILRNPEKALNSNTFKVFLAEEYWKSVQASDSRGRIP